MRRVLEVFFTATIAAFLFAAAACSGGQAALDSGDGGLDASFDAAPLSPNDNPPQCPPTLPWGPCNVPKDVVCHYGCNDAGVAGLAACTTISGPIPTRTWTISVAPAETCIPPAPAPFACGTATCSPTQLCIIPCCGGAPPLCTKLPDSGTCPPGSERTTFCRNLGDEVGCAAADECTPAPPYCVDKATDITGCSIDSTTRLRSRTVQCVCG